MEISNADSKLDSLDWSREAQRKKAALRINSEGRPPLLAALRFATDFGPPRNVK